MKTNLKKHITFLLVFMAVVLTVLITGCNWVVAAGPQPEVEEQQQNTAVSSGGSSNVVREGNIHAAAKAGDMDTVKRLLASNAALLETKDKKGFTFSAQSIACWSPEPVGWL
jgi:hypothetical protein